MLEGLLGFRFGGGQTHDEKRRGVLPVYLCKTMLQGGKRGYALSKSSSYDKRIPYSTIDDLADGMAKLGSKVQIVVSGLGLWTDTLGNLDVRKLQEVYFEKTGRELPLSPEVRRRTSVSQVKIRGLSAVGAGK